MRPQSGICCDCWTSGNPGIGGGRVTDIRHTESVPMIIKERNFEDSHTNNFYELVALMDAVSVAKKMNLSEVWTDSSNAMSWFKKGLSKDATKKYLESAPEDYKKINLAIQYLRQHASLEPAEGRVQIKKWEKAWGEIPADYNRK